MKYLYHMIPYNMKGEKLIPLNKLKDTYFDIYDDHKKKYNGREFLMDEVVPKLNCKWNDVLHFTAVRPEVVKKALVDAGMKDIKDSQFYKVPMSLFVSNSTVVYKYTRNDAEITDDEIEYLNDVNFPTSSELSPDTIEWYQSCIEKGRRPLLFHRVPHILTLESIDISECEIVDW